jgi:hypothetical protein
MPQSYASKKAAWTANPARHARLMAQQAASRRRRAARERSGEAPPCQYPDGSPCWRTDTHVHVAQSPRQGNQYRSAPESTGA